MELRIALSEKNKKLLPVDFDEVLYCAPYDIAEDGKYLRDSFVAVSESGIYILNEGRLLKTFNIKEYETFKAEVGVSCGILYGIPKGGDESKAQIIVKYSSSHLARYAYIAKGCRFLAEGKKDRVVSEEYEKYCPKCGRALPGTRTCPRCAGKNEGLIHELLTMMKPYRPQLLVIFILMLLAALTTLLNPEIQKHLIDDVLKKEDGDIRLAMLCLGGMLAMSVGIAVVNLLKNYFCAKLGSVISMDLRKKLYSKIQLLSLSYVNERKPGDLMNRITRDTQRISDFMGDTFCNLFTVAIILICDVAYMLFLDAKLTLISMVFIPLSVFISIAFRHNIHRRFHMQWVKDDKINSNLRDVLSGMSVVKAYGKEEEESEHFNDTADDFAETQRRNETFWAVFFPLMQFMMGVGIYLVTYFSGKSVLLGTKAPGELTQFVNYTSMMYMYVGWLSNMPRMLMNLVTSVERISDVMQQEPKIADSEKAVEHKIKGSIEFKDVTFGYKTYEPILEHIDLKVKPGEMIGLVGASGAGKSTLINLVMHLYDIDDGELLVDGINIKDIKLANYHSQIGVVLQETFLFSGTILNNIRFARPEATTMEVIRAAKMANAHDFICKTPDGYNTYVGEKGYNLSGGERQRIAIARAILNDPRILILDEATASLDTESEYLIQTALDRLTEGKTTFAIAHRLSTLKNADRLVVIDGHSIAEVGSHNELMEKKGIYYGLVTAQLEMQGTPVSEAIA
ncbi:MAG: ABC transporter ATP-binding protein [Lachnospiraceae bacterium]|nr:ABC transporter ATP-binding protein [Lachnospiraceae bacterium]